MKKAHLLVSTARALALIQDSLQGCCAEALSQRVLSRARGKVGQGRAGQGKSGQHTGQGSTEPLQRGQLRADVYVLHSSNAMNIIMLDFYRLPDLVCGLLVASEDTKGDKYSKQQSMQIRP